MLRLLVLATLGLLGCLPSVEETCSDIATTQCQQCYSCSDDFDGSALCGTDGTEEQCVATLSARCETQAATVEDSKGALDECLQQFETYQCEALLRDFASGSTPVPDRCGYYL